MKASNSNFGSFVVLQPAVMVGSVSRAKSKKSWLRLAKERRPQPPVPSPIYQHHQQPQQIHPAALIHRDYLQVSSRT